MIHAGEHSVKVVCSELSDLENYTQPHAPGDFSFHRWTRFQMYAVKPPKIEFLCLNHSQPSACSRRAITSTSFPY